MIPAVYALCKFGSWAFLRLTRGYRVIGVERIPAAGPLIIACNHVSYFDPPALGAAVPRPVSYMAKSELFAIPVLGPLIRALGAVPVDRSRGDVAAMRAAVRVLQAGAVFGIFPEGGRNLDGTKTPQLGVALLASWSGATVLPAYVSGTSQGKRAGPGYRSFRRTSSIRAGSESEARRFGEVDRGVNGANLRVAGD